MSRDSSFFNLENKTKIYLTLMSILQVGIIIILLLMNYNELFASSDEKSENSWDDFSDYEISEEEGETEPVIIGYSATTLRDLNVRVEPNAEADRISMFRINTQVTVIGEVLDNGWCQVKGIDRSGVEVVGYCNSDYLQLGDPVLEIPDNSDYPVLPPKDDATRVNGIVLVENEGDYLFTLHDVPYFKLNDGTSYLTSFKDKDGDYYFAMFAEDEDSAEFCISTNDYRAAATPRTIIVDGDKYYYSVFRVYDESSVKAFYRCKFHKETLAIKESINVLKGNDPLKDAGLDDKAYLYIDSEIEGVLLNILMLLIVIDIVYFGRKLWKKITE